MRNRTRENAAALFLCALLSLGLAVSGCKNPIAADSGSVALGAQTGTLVAGSAGSVSFAATTTNVADGTAGDIAWFASSDGATAATAPEGITATVSAVSGNSATVTMAAGASTAAGSYFFSLTEGKAVSAVATLVVSAAVPRTRVAFTGLSANGSSGSVTTTVLTLSFDADPTSLASSDITVTGAARGALGGSGTTRSLAISGIAVVDGADVTVSIADPSGYSISPSSRNVAVCVAPAPVAVAFTGLSANGSSGSVTTTVLTLTFDRNPSTLASGDIAVTGATKGALSGSGTTRSLAISDITVANGADITVTLSNPSGYSISPSSRTVAANCFSLGLALVNVPAGTFQRDGTAGNTSYVSAFRMGTFEVTRAQFLAIMGSDPSDTAHSTGSGDPVQNVNWYHAIAFCNKLSIAEGLTPVYGVTVSGVPVNFATLTYADVPTTFNSGWDSPTANWSANGYRLPTEMEWMWAAMGADSANPGSVNTTGYAKDFAGSTGSNAIGDCAVYGLPSSTGSSSPAGSKQANELGIHDMSGNVWEPCWDGVNTSSPYPAYRISGAVSDYRGENSGNRIIRGGGWTTNTTYCKVAARSYVTYTTSNYQGFRVVRY